MSQIDELEKRWATFEPKKYTEAQLKEIETITAKLSFCGRMICGSKSSYKGKAVFNANLCTDERKLWYGDIDLEKDAKKLQSIADTIGKKLYVLREMDGRFENENSPKLERALLILTPKRR